MGFNGVGADLEALTSRSKIGFIDAMDVGHALELGKLFHQALQLPRVFYINPECVLHHVMSGCGR